MNEIESQNIDQLTSEIVLLKHQTAQNIIEIGKRLNKAKEMLPHGEWGKWLEQEVDFRRETASRFMRVAREFSNVTSISHLGTGKLFALLDVPQPEREEFIESNPVDEMTTRQLQQAIKEKKELERQLQEEKNKPPEVKEKEVIPSDYESSKAKLKESEKKQEELKSKIEVLQSRVGDIEKYKGEVRNIKTKKDELNNEISNLYAELSKLKQETSIEEAHRKNIARISTLIRIGNEQKKKHMTELDQISREVKDLPGITKKHIHNELEVLYKYTEIIENLLNQTTVEVLSYE